jgi:ribosomal protein S18 acetylase RimI-like enzyme
VKENFRRKGIGKLLFEELLNWFRKRKVKFVEVEVDSRNKIGIEAYKKYGFFEFHKRMRLDL